MSQGSCILRSSEDLALNIVLLKYQMDDVSFFLIIGHLLLSIANENRKNILVSMFEPSQRTQLNKLTMYSKVKEHS